MSTVEITWLGHATYSLEIGGSTVLVDPFLNDSPVAPVKADDVAADCILVTHGHFDHVSDVVSIAQRTGATVVANLEIVEWLKKQGVAEEKVVGMNLGGGVDLPFGHVKMTVAQHSSGLPDGTYGGSAAGFVLSLPKARIYFAGDTALMLDMKLIGMSGLDWAVLPIGDLFTMGPDDSIEAIKLLNPRRVIPCHYNTWPPIEQDAAAWAGRVRSHTAAEPVVLEPGEKCSL
ncbi:MAG: metal-dependent hydrolase [Planctomycetes bacterium]|nr:metal-dependent hydrolase [Planctomycetota bacterium]